MSGVYIKNMEIPKDCPMCPMAHWDLCDNFCGCEIVPGKKYAMLSDHEYANSDTRPKWCPLIPVPDHGDLIDRKDVYGSILNGMVMTGYQSRALDCIAEYNVPTIIPADKEKNT